MSLHQPKLRYDPCAQEYTLQLQYHAKTHTHTQTDVYIHTDFEKYSIVVFCGDPEDNVRDFNNKESYNILKHGSALLYLKEVIHFFYFHLTKSISVSQFKTSNSLVNSVRLNLRQCC